MTPHFLRPLSIGFVAIGGAIGAGAREGLILIVPAEGPLPWAVLAANLLGAFLLGLLSEALLDHPAFSPGRSQRHQRLRLLLGTGFCGGFTTYSTLALGTAALAGGTGGGPPAWNWAISYAVGTVVVGAFATWCGILLGSISRRRTHFEPPRQEPAELIKHPSTPPGGAS
ncbi:fluoride efflux transporter FluC [Arthrobacter cryoconiti]|uniref:Fluoride-specific ion channel FluC n=1 Tax=Arthrobacter cryoconiti TaxID=748907 RepID=A0ABV8R0X2_9MICC|nr:CrcB family protein [Arthrobacter cryoconiti]MCC9069137.1 CrcB family protein [Arthrobacter cryoconiti]